MEHGRTSLNLLVIDDDPGVTALVRTVAEGVGFNVHEANHYDSFLASYDVGPLSAVLLDLQMPDRDGIEYLRTLGETKSQAQIIVMSGYDSRVLDSAFRLGQEFGLSMLDRFQKPISMRSLRRCLERITSANTDVTTDSIRKGMENDEFVLHYQPKYKLPAVAGAQVRREHQGQVYTIEHSGRNWTLDGAEALARWQKPGGTVVSPNAFIPIMESEGLMEEFTDYVMRGMVEQMGRWRVAGFAPVVSFNFSPFAMNNLEIPDRLAKLCASNGVESKNVTVEITETAAMSDAKKCIDILSRLRLKGFGVAIDDFGTGFSSLKQLYNMPFTELKIDKSIAGEINKTNGADTIAKAIIDLAHNLRLDVVAEGVETVETLDRLIEMECDIVQGFLFGKPVSADDFETMFVK